MSDKTKITAPKVPQGARGLVAFGLGVIVVAFGVMGTWTATAKIDSAVFGSGAVQVESRNKTVQHLEGGIVRAIHVREAERVKKGDLLVDLETTQSKANLDALNNQLYTEIVTIARLEAEQRGEDEISLPEEVTALRDSDPVVKAAIEDQQMLFERRRDFIGSQIDILNARIEQLKQQNNGLKLQKEAIQEQLDLFDDELDSLVTGTEKGVYPKNQLLQKRRQYASLKGEKGELISDIATNEGSILEIEEQKKQVAHSFLQEVGDLLTRSKLNRDKLREQVIVANDVFTRNQIYAPYDGVVQNIRFHTVGGVIQRGEAIMDLIPINDDLEVSVRVQPVNIDKIRLNLESEVRFPSFATRRLPLIIGTVTAISADTLVDRATNSPYFSVQVHVPKENIPDEVRDLITPGLPADVVISTGERTVLNYLISPLENTVRRAMREE